MKLSEILERSAGAKLVAVSKNVDTPEVEKLIAQGQMDFGENRVQELKRKISILGDSNLNWHFIGRLQTNKINALVALRPCLWQSCESLAHAVEVNKRLNYKLPTLLQINSANEDTKQGVSVDEAVDVYEQILAECPNIALRGVMSIGAHTDDTREIARSFEATRAIFERLAPHGATICSMGMSDDFELAIKCGSNMVRLGRILYN